jgi:hypothetical protein
VITAVLTQKPDTIAAANDTAKWKAQAEPTDIAVGASERE